MATMLDAFGVTATIRTEATAVISAGRGVLARVISQSKGIYRVVTDSGERPAEITGKLRHAALCKKRDMRSHISF